MKTMRISSFLAGAMLTLFVAGVSNAARAQTFSVLYNFGTKTTDPISPSYEGIIAQGRDGNLYSTTASGATDSFGDMFKITPTGTLTVPHRFSSSEGYSESGLTLGTDGNLYGTTASGGTSNEGIVFKVTGSGTLSALSNLSGGSQGPQAYAPPIQGTDGNFYGTTLAGGTDDDGTVYKMTPAGKLTTLYSFDYTHGRSPFAPLVQGSDGSFYGTTQTGGANPSWGVIYKITSSGKLIVIYNFDGTHGGQSLSPLVQGSDGNFYGTTTGGGTKSAGVIFRVTPTGKFTVLHNLNGTSDGNQLWGGLVQASDGNFYGTTNQGGTSKNCSSGCGTIFQITPKGVYKVLYNFDGTTGQLPYTTLFQNTNGVLYGDTSQGGAGKQCACGTFFSLDMKLKPFASLIPTSGKVNKSIGILGQSFTKATSVSFNGTAATYKVVSDTFLTATVPSGATTGFVTVNTPGGTLTSNQQFMVTPVILSFSPTSGGVGTPVTITGTSFTGATKVTFGGVKATTFSVDSDTKITANVPTGAKTGKIAVTTPGGIATSKDVFTVTQ